LEIKKTLSQQNLDNYVEMAAENKLSVEKKFEEVFITCLQHALPAFTFLFYA